MHKNYIDRTDIKLNSKLMGQIAILLREMPYYTSIRYDKTKNKIALQYSSDFDEANEPEVTETISYDGNGEIKRIEANSPYKTQIWHHKWMWVDIDYAGFDVMKSRARSEMYKKYITKEDKPRIGYKKYWDEIRKRWE